VKASHFAWVMVALLWGVALLNYLDRQVVFSMFPPLRRDLGFSNVELGLLSTVFLWPYAVLSPWAAYLGERLGRARTIVLSLAVWSLVTLATGHARSVGSMLIARGLLGISEAFCLPVALALIADYHGSRTRSLATGIQFTGSYLGFVVAGAGGGWMAEHYGWRSAFTVLGVAGVVYSVFLLFVMPWREKSAAARPPQAPLHFASSVRELFRLAGFLRLTMAFSMMSIANFIVFTWLPIYIYERFRVSLTSAGFSATFYIQVGSFSGILLGGWLADRWARSTGRGRVLTQVVGLAAAAPFLFVVGFTASPVLLDVCLVPFGLGRGMFDCNAMPVLCQIAPEEHRSIGYGIFNLAGCLCGGLMAAVAGYLKSTLGLVSAFALAALVLLVAVGLLLGLRLPAAVAVGNPESVK